MKTCSTCLLPKEEADFNRRLASRDGLAALCRECQRSVNRAVYQKTKRSVNEYRRIYQRERRRIDLDFRLRHLLRTRLTKFVSRNRKSGSAVRDLGCTIPELKTWLEAKFYPHPETGEAMSWENYGEWHIDHKKALKHFDLTDRNQLLRACHYTNLQPLWAEQNLAKGAREAA